jgi:fructose-1,6-bisphosphatase/inositol monophosphatase family enzyme
MLDGTMAAWDSAALQPVIEEAGGVFTDWAGARTAFGGNAIATSAALADAVRAAVREQP